MGTVTISANSYNIYGTLSGATNYLAARLDAGAWASATADQKAQALVTATRSIEAYLKSKGHEVDPAGAVDAAIESATYELAFALIVNPALQDQSSSGNNKRRVKAGSAEVEYFRPETGGRYPSIVQTLLSGWLTDQGGGAGSLGLPFASGTCERSTLTPNASYIGAGSCE
jgi:hypothetical protein